MRIIGLLLLAFSFSFGSTAAKVVKVDEMFADSKNCKACHLHQVKEWSGSWHAKSHFAKDEYFKKSIEYYSKKTRRSLNGVKVQCATCHNPRISVTSTGMSYEIDAVLGLDKGSTVNKALEDEHLQEGINCVVCHNIDKIHSNRDQSFRGINRISWTPSGVMSGPYDDAKSPYHKVEHRDFMNKNSDKLCFVCHANDKSYRGLVFTNMQKEYKSGKKQCVDCHMGAKKEGYASTLKSKNINLKKRTIRGHGFAGAHDEDMIKGSLELSAWQKGKDLIVSLKNPQPHNIPSGMGARELLVELEYSDSNSVIKSEVVSLTTHYKDRRGKTTIPHLAKTQSKDMSVPAEGKKAIKVQKEDGATSVKITVFYRLVNDEVRELLDLKEKIWSKKMFITSKRLELK